MPAPADRPVFLEALRPTWIPLINRYRGELRFPMWAPADRAPVSAQTYACGPLKRTIATVLRAGREHL